MEEKYIIKSYSKVGVKTKKFGLTIDDFILFVKISAYSVAGLGTLKIILPIPLLVFVIWLGVLTLLYLILYYGNKDGKDYFLLSRASRFFMQYRRLHVSKPRQLIENKLNSTDVK